MVTVSLESGENSGKRMMQHFGTYCVTAMDEVESVK
jgi:hypothetical protein